MSSSELLKQSDTTLKNPAFQRIAAPSFTPSRIENLVDHPEFTAQKGIVLGTLFTEAWTNSGNDLLVRIRKSIRDYRAATDQVGKNLAAQRATENLKKIANLAAQIEDNQYATPTTKTDIRNLYEVAAREVASIRNTPPAGPQGKTGTPPTNPPPAPTPPVLPITSGGVGGRGTL